MFVSGAVQPRCSAGRSGSAGSGGSSSSFSSSASRSNFVAHVIHVEQRAGRKPLLESGEGLRLFGGEVFQVAEPDRDDVVLAEVDPPLRQFGRRQHLHAAHVGDL